MTLRRRLGTLEAKRKGPAPTFTDEKLKSLSEEDLDSLEDSLETGLEQGTGNFRDLYRVVSERTRRACVALFDTLEAVNRGEDPPSRDPPEDSAFSLIERMTSGDEEDRREARQAWEARNGYRIWKYYQK